VESDPIGLRGGLSTYLYVGATPLVGSDPDGLEPPGGMRFRGYDPRQTQAGVLCCDASKLTKCLAANPSKFCSKCTSEGNIRTSYACKQCEIEVYVDISCHIQFCSLGKCPCDYKKPQS
jgi:uncharacterized protein RhaS with RHS repeats